MIRLFKVSLSKSKAFEGERSRVQPKGWLWDGGIPIFLRHIALPQDNSPPTISLVKSKKHCYSLVLVRARYLVVDSQVEAVLRGHFSIEVPVDEEFPGGDVDAEHGVGVTVGDGVQQVAVEAEVPVVRVNLENKATLKSQMSRLYKVKGFLKPSQLSPPSKKPP